MFRIITIHLHSLLEADELAGRDCFNETVTMFACLRPKGKLFSVTHTGVNKSLLSEETNILVHFNMTE